MIPVHIDATWRNRKLLRCSAVDPALHGFGVAVDGEVDLVGGAGDVCQVRIGELEVGGAGDVCQVRIGELEVGGGGVFAEAVGFGGAGDRHDRGVLGEDPGQRDLGGGGVQTCRDSGDDVDQGLVGGAGFFGEPREVVSEVSIGEAGGGVDAAGEEALAERAERHQADAQLEQGGQDFGFGFTPEQRVLTLQRGDGLDGVGAADDVDTGFGQAEVGDLPGVDQLFYGPGDVLDRHLGVDPVLVQQVDPVGVEPAQRILDGGPDVVRLAVESVRAAVVDAEPELGGDHDLVPDRGQGLT